MTWVYDEGKSISITVVVGQGYGAIVDYAVGYEFLGYAGPGPFAPGTSLNAWAKVTNNGEADNIRLTITRSDTGATTYDKYQYLAKGESMTLGHNFIMPNVDVTLNFYTYHEE